MSLINTFIVKSNEICRTCLGSGQLLTNLFDEDHLVQKLKSCTGLPFDECEQKPNKICATCIVQLLQTYNFIKRCLTSDSTLKLNEQIKVEFTNEDIVYYDENNISIKDELIETQKSEIIDSPIKQNEKKRKRDVSPDLADNLEIDISKNKTLVTPSRAKPTCICPVCPKKFISTIGMLKHFQTHTETKNHKSIEQLITKKVTKKKTSFKCELCKQNFLNAEILVEHYKQHINARKCEFCNKIFKTTALLNKHSLNYHKSKRVYQCEICSKNLLNFDAFQRHKHKNHGIPKIHLCNICLNTYDTFELFETHLRSHLGDGPYDCLSCAKNFANVEHLLTHKLGEKCGKIYYCTICPKVFQLLKLRNQHKKIEHF